MFFLAVYAPAYASEPCDGDNDGYVEDLQGCNPDPEFPEIFDCDDGDVTVNPGAEEIPNDGVDDDCNGWDKLVRAVLEDFRDLDDWSTSASWNPPGGAVFTVPGGVKLDPAILPGNVSKPSAIELDASFDWLAGVPTVGIEVRQWTTPVNCTVKLVGTSAQTVGLDGVGRYMITFNDVGIAPFVMNDIEVRCSGSGAAVISYFALADGGSLIGLLAPGFRNSRTWFDTNMPGGGENHLVLVPTPDGLYAASDVGGVAFSDTNGDTWQVRNGDVGNGLDRAYDLAVWGLGVDPEDSGRVWALSGNYASSGRFGGLFGSDDGGLTWENLATESSSIPVATFGAEEMCDNTDSKAVAGGKLMLYVEHPYGTASDESDYLVFANHGADLMTGYDLSILDGVSSTTGTTVCSPFTGLPDAPVSALAILDDGDDHALLVGFKGWWDDTGAAEGSGLYRCDLPETGTSGSAVACASSPSWTCTEMTDSSGVDVRDIEVDSTNPTGTAWVADAKRVPNSTDDCSASETGARVWQWDVDATTAADVGTLTDVTGAMSGDQLPTSDDYRVAEISGLAMDPSSNFLIAFFNTSQDKSYDYTQTRIWRGEADYTSGITWETMMADDDVAPTERTTRGGYVTAGGSGLQHWMMDQDYLADWAPAYAVDGAFAENDRCDDSSDVCLLVGDGFGMWQVDGWDKDFSVEDVDEAMEWHYNLGSWMSEFQTSVVTDVAVTRQQSDPFGFSATADLGGMKLPVPTPSTPPTWLLGGRAETWCNWDRWNAASGAVDIYEDGDGTAYVWYGVVDQGTESGWYAQGVARYDVGADTWCFEGTNSSSAKGSDGTLECKEGASADDWSDCGGSGIGWETTTDPIGNPSDIVAINDDVAIVSAVGDTDYHDIGLFFTEDGGATWDEVTFTVPSGSSCTEADFFQTRVHMDAHPTRSYYNSSTDYEMELVLSGRDTSGGTDCPLLYVTWDETTGVTGATWDDIEVTTDCDFDEITVADAIFANVSGTEGDTILVANYLGYTSSAAYGGVCGIETDSWTDQEELVSGADALVSFVDILPDPETADAFYLAAQVDEAERNTCVEVYGAATCDADQWPGPYQLEYADDGTGTMVWTASLMGTKGLANRNITSLDWGGEYDGAETFDVLYAGTTGSGVYHYRNSQCEGAPFLCW